MSHMYPQHINLSTKYLKMPTKQLYLISVFFTDVSIDIITQIDPKTGQLSQKVVKTVTDPESGQTYKVVSEIPPEQNVHIVTKQDPITGKITQKLVQTVTDTVTGEVIQEPFETSIGIIL